MKETILVKLGEIVLKGLNRRMFEDVLMKNIRRRLKVVGNFDVKNMQSTIYVIPRDDDSDLDEAVECLQKIFGIVAISRSCMVEKDMDAIKKATVEYLDDILSEIKTFKVESKRADKKFPYKSPEISMEVGGYILEKYPNLTVDVHNPDFTVVVEVRDVAAYIRGNTVQGAGGMPVGTSGRAAILISGGIDSPVAAWMMAKRGIELTAIHFASPPYTSERAEQKVVSLLEKVSAYSGRMQMMVVPFTRIQEEIREKCPEELFTIIMRRYMMKISQKLAERDDCHALITGESVAQVASQTIYAIECTDAAAQMPVFRPLIGMDKEEIVRISRKIDTFDISIQPFEDCCTVFTPKHPRTKPALKFVEKAEEVLNEKELIEECLNNIRYIHIGNSK